MESIHLQDSTGDKENRSRKNSHNSYHRAMHQLHLANSVVSKLLHKADTSSKASRHLQKIKFSAIHSDSIIAEIKMSLLLEYMKIIPKETKRLIGIDYEKLQQLFTQAEALHYETSRNEADKFRLNSKGAGCKPKLSLQEQMLLTLVYLSQLHTFQYLGVQFGVSESTANIFPLLVEYFTELLPASLLEQVKKIQ